jgi:hypothetical protein
MVEAATVETVAAVVSKADINLIEPITEKSLLGTFFIAILIPCQASSEYQNAFWNFSENFVLFANSILENHFCGYTH